MTLKVNLLLLAILSCGLLSAQNVFLNRSYWKNNPSLEQVKIDVKAGNDATELNRNAFDATIYAMLEKANDDVVKYLLSFEGNTIDKKTHDSRIYLHWAAYAGQVKIVNYLLEKGSSVTELDSHGYTPLAFAANAGQKNTAIFESFEEYGVNLLAEKNENGANLLLLVAPALATEVELSYFINKGFSLDSKDAINNGIFNYAAKKGNVDFLKLLVAKGVDYKSLNSKGGNAVLYTSFGTRGSSYDVEMFKYLESLGIAINVVGDNGRNPLHRIAYRSNDLSLLQYFIDKGVDINLQDNGGDSPFMNAANSNTLQVVKYLYPKVKNINAKDQNGRSALAMAVNRNTPEVVEFLLNKNAAIEMVDTQNNTLAYYLLNAYKANNTGSFEAKLKLLLDRGLSMRTVQNNGNTLLHIATLNNDLALLKRLASFDIDINTKNDDGYTVLQIAAMKAHSSDILQYLIANGADKTVITEFEESVYDLATANELLQQNDSSLKFLK
ncbi:ankyrin repeat domain-containing protein [Nonlabens ulvanivorans]|uniref:ankyrin repeat domain-containing protein n=1 Tax=Nonlabens ulvanivorans TaxID=906888 RepID=UPI00294212A9|nr:ankyrin repeat domain-containing protein [Nonlabens ulvanivorans]WOI21813.1 ankyrin repeat domain-containing protein [Nonlabens ulvanivorans]